MRHTCEHQGRDPLRPDLRCDACRADLNRRLQDEGHVFVRLPTTAGVWRGVYGSVEANA